MRVATGSESRLGASGGASCRVLTPPSSEPALRKAARSALRTCYGSGQRAPQPVLFHPPVPVLGAVDQDHRDAVAVLRAPLRVRVDVLRLPRVAQLSANPGDVRLRDLAEVAPHPAHDRHFVRHAVLTTAPNATACGGACRWPSAAATRRTPRRAAPCTRPGGPCTGRRPAARTATPRRPAPRTPSRPRRCARPRPRRRPPRPPPAAAR